MAFSKTMIGDADVDVAFDVLDDDFIGVFRKDRHFDSLFGQLVGADIARAVGAANDHQVAWKAVEACVAASAGGADIDPHDEVDFPEVFGVAAAIYEPPFVVEVIVPRKAIVISTVLKRRRNPGVVGPNIGRRAVARPIQSKEGRPGRAIGAPSAGRRRVAIVASLNETA